MTTPRSVLGTARAVAPCATVSLFCLLCVAAPRASGAQPIPGYGIQAWSAHPHGTAVAVGLRIPVGSADDPEGLEGSAWVLAATLEDQVKRALGTKAAVFSGSVERGSTVFTLLAEPSEWERAWAVADSVLFGATLDPTLVQRHRAALLERLTFEAGSPVRTFEAEAARLLSRAGSRYVRPQRGTHASLTAITLGSLEALRGSAWRRERGAVAVVGPLTLAPPSGGAAEPGAGEVAPGRPVLPADGEAPWSTRERRVVVQDVTNAWVTVAYPAPAGIPRTHVELVAHLISEELDPFPPAAERYSAAARIEDTPAGAVLVVEASVFPEAAELWEERILRLVDRLGREPMGADFFAWRRRRFRAACLLQQAAPEEEARRMTADLLREGRVRDLGGDIWALDARAAQAAASALGPPRILVVGPDLHQGGGAMDDAEPAPGP